MAFPTTPILILSLLSGLSCFAFFVSFIVQLKKRALLGIVSSFLLATTMLCVALLTGVVCIGLGGYRSLTAEEVAAVITIEPLGLQRFRAHFNLADGRQQIFELAGDELMVDAHILKWQPLGTLLGLGTEYELDRVSGRYARIEDERHKRRTAHSLSDKSVVDLFALRRRFDRLSPLYDAEYGSASFVPADGVRTYELRISTSGLLLRPLEKS